LKHCSPRRSEGWEGKQHVMQSRSDQDSLAICTGGPATRLQSPRRRRPPDDLIETIRNAWEVMSLPRPYDFAVLTNDLFAAKSGQSEMAVWVRSRRIM